MFTKETLPKWAKWEDKWTHKVDGATGCLISIDDFREWCEEGFIMDMDGHGDMLNEGKWVNYICIKGKLYKGSNISPSEVEWLPDEVTHILWCNK